MPDKAIPPEPGMNLQTIYEEQPITSLIALAIAQLGSPGAKSAAQAVEKLVDLKLKVDRIDAEKEFNKALAEFQQDCPQIQKTKKSKDRASNDGTKFGFMFAPLDVVERTVRPHLQSRGFSYYWTGRVYIEGGKLLREETCYLLHKNGHKTSSTSTVPLEGDVGKMNDMQKFGTGETYAKRYSLVAVLGIPTTDEDTDGADPTLVDDKELEHLKTLVAKAMPPGYVPRFLSYMKVDKIEDIRKVEYGKAVLAIEEMRKAVEKKAAT